MMEDPTDFWVMEQVLAIMSHAHTHTLSLSHARTHTHTPNNESRTDPIKLICQFFFSQTLAMNKMSREKREEIIRNGKQHQKISREGKLSHQIVQIGSK